MRGGLYRYREGRADIERKRIRPYQCTHEQVFESLKTNKFVSWFDLLDNHIQVKERKRGKPSAPSTISETMGLIKSINPLCPYPTQLTKELVKLMVK